LDVKRAREEEGTEREAYAEILAPADEVEACGKKCSGSHYPPGCRTPGMNAGNYSGGVSDGRP
jgi:hypothetical protein